MINTINFRDVRVDGLQVDIGFELIIRVFVLESRNSEHIARVHIAEVDCSYREQGHGNSHIRILQKLQAALKFTLNVPTLTMERASSVTGNLRQARAQIKHEF
jgi:hypothetical protein